MSARPGRFITLEGGEGAGKSTLAAGLAQALSAEGRTVTRTREPGGSPGADAVRALLVRGDAERWSVLSEALLLAAARNDHLERAIRPALAAGHVVICDRYSDSTWAYQVAARGLDETAFHALSHLIAADTPDLTFILDIDPDIGLARSRGAGLGEDRYERMDLRFHATVRQAFLDIAQREPQRCAVLNAAHGADAVLADALAVLRTRLP
ncbi:MAG: dTMP kinase [Alphaproteobacteria bacterium]|nr:dTMP kinase [Alphaproteobacteria bacterium]